MPSPRSRTGKATTLPIPESILEAGTKSRDKRRAIEAAAERAMERQIDYLRDESQMSDMDLHVIAQEGYKAKDDAASLYCGYVRPYSLPFLSVTPEVLSSIGVSAGEIMGYLEELQQDAHAYGSTRIPMALADYDRLARVAQSIDCDHFVDILEDGWNGGRSRYSGNENEHSDGNAHIPPSEFRAPARIFVSSSNEADAVLQRISCVSDNLLGRCIQGSFLAKPDELSLNPRMEYVADFHPENVETKPIETKRIEAKPIHTADGLASEALRPSLRMESETMTAVALWAYVRDKGFRGKVVDYTDKPSIGASVEIPKSLIGVLSSQFPHHLLGVLLSRARMAPSTEGPLGSEGPLGIGGQHGIEGQNKMLRSCLPGSYLAKGCRTLRETLGPPHVHGEGLGVGVGAHQARTDTSLCHPMLVGPSIVSVRVLALSPLIKSHHEGHVRVSLHALGSEVSAEDIASPVLGSRTVAVGSAPVVGSAPALLGSVSGSYTQQSSSATGVNITVKYPNNLYVSDLNASGDVVARPCTVLYGDGLSHVDWTWNPETRAINITNFPLSSSNCVVSLYLKNPYFHFPLSREWSIEPVMGGNVRLPGEVGSAGKDLNRGLGTSLSSGLLALKVTLASGISLEFRASPDGIRLEASSDSQLMTVCEQAMRGTTKFIPTGLFLYELARSGFPLVARPESMKGVDRSLVSQLASLGHLFSVKPEKESSIGLRVVLSGTGVELSVTGVDLSGSPSSEQLKLILYKNSTCRIDGDPYLHATAFDAIGNLPQSVLSGFPSIKLNGLESTAKIMGHVLFSERYLASRQLSILIRALGGLQAPV